MKIIMPDLGAVTIPASLLTPHMIDTLIQGLDTQLLEADEHSTTLNIVEVGKLLDQLFEIRGSLIAK